jgi:hypothetical protein
MTSTSANYAATADATVANALTGLAADAGTGSAAVRAMEDALAVQTASADARASSANQQLDDQAVRRRIARYAVMNETQNTNAFVLQLMGREKTRLTSATRDVSREQYKLRYAQLRNDYLLGYYGTSTRFVVLTLYVTVLLFMVAALWRADLMNVVLFAAIAVLLTLAYLCVAVSVASGLALRRPDAGWNQFDFKVPPSMDSGPSACAAPDADYMTAVATPGAAGQQQLSCADSAARYVADNALIDGMLPTSDRAGNVIPASLRAWWHFYVQGDSSGWTWPYGSACQAATTPDQAARMYTDKYLPPGQTSFGPSTTPYQDFVANQATRGDWPGQVGH